MSDIGDSKYQDMAGREQGGMSMVGEGKGDTWETGKLGTRNGGCKVIQANDDHR